MAARETLLTGKETLKKKTKHECKQQQQQHRGRTNTLTIDNSDCLVLFKKGQFYTSDGFEKKTLLQGEHQEPKPQQKTKKKQRTGKLEQHGIPHGDDAGFLLVLVLSLA
jgi:hypothetical protein